MAVAFNHGSISRLILINAPVLQMTNLITLNFGVVQQIIAFLKETSIIVKGTTQTMKYTLQK